MLFPTGAAGERGRALGGRVGAPRRAGGRLALLPRHVHAVRRAHAGLRHHTGARLL